MSDHEIIVMNFLTRIENMEFIPVPISNQEYLSNFIGEKVLVTVRKRNKIYYSWRRKNWKSRIIKLDKHIKKCYLRKELILGMCKKGVLQ